MWSFSFGERPNPGRALEDSMSFFSKLFDPSAGEIKRLNKIVDKIDSFEEEHKALTDEQQPERIAQVFARRYPNTALVLTLGSHGSIYRDGTVSVDQAPYDAKPVDTTGAGDTFTGYFAAAISRGRAPAEAMRYASAASAMATETMGAANSIPTLAEVEARIASEG